MEPCLDLNRTSFSKRHGDITVKGSWFRDGEGGSQPCLVLIRSIAMSGRPVVPCVILLNEAYVWFPNDVGEPRRAARMAAEFAEVLGLERHWQSVARIAEIVQDHLDELIAMKPEPKREAILVGEARIAERDSGRVFETEITTTRH